MAVNISKLWKDKRFNSLSTNSKLLYIYLATDPNLNTVGVLCPNLDVVCLELNVNIGELKMATIHLRTAKYIYVKQYDDTIYFVVPAHFNTIPKAAASIKRVEKDLEQLPEGLVKFLASIKITSGSKVKEFTKPTAQEVTEYALSQGYIIDGEEFVGYYNRISDTYGKKDTWVDGNGRQVRDWKGKLRRVWCKEDKKIPKVDGAPKGFEHYHVFENGTLIVPEKWKNGQPWSSSVSSDIILKRHFKK